MEGKIGNADLMHHQIRDLMFSQGEYEVTLAWPGLSTSRGLDNLSRIFLSIVYYSFVRTMTYDATILKIT